MWKIYICVYTYKDMHEIIKKFVFFPKITMDFMEICEFGTDNVWLDIGYQ